jgi:hypothetical protein
MKKILPVITVLAMLLSACNIIGGSAQATAVSDAEMATRVAELLSTMTTPTTEIVFPPTPTPTATSVILPTVQLPTETAAPEVTEIITATPDLTTTVETTTEVTEDPETDETPTPTLTATVSSNDPANNLGAPTGSDPLDSYSNWGWPTGTDEYLKIAFNNGKMEMTGLTTIAGWRLPMLAQQMDTYIETTVDTGTCEGKDSYGIIFRVPIFLSPDQGYLYQITCDGYYRVWKWDATVGTKGQATLLVPWSQSTLIKTGADQTNRLGVMVEGDDFTFYMNGEKLASASDASFEAGFFGLFVQSVETDDYTVKFDSMRYWANP